MPLSPKSTGFSDNGLSYEVAGDYNKLLGQALANYEARTSNPRSYQESDADYAARVGSASGILGNELAPLGIGNALSSTLLKQQRGAASDGIRNVAPGSSVGRFNPATGQFEALFTNPAKKTMDEKTKNEIGIITKNVNDLYKTYNTSTDNLVKGGIAKRIRDLEQQKAALFAPADLTQANTATAPAVPVAPQGPAPTPYAFMGTPGSTNLIQGSLGQQPALAAIVRPGQRGRLSKDQAGQFFEQAKGDKEMARKLAREAGYEF